jgi:hypothetical protein
MEYKIFGAEFKAQGDKGEYEGYFSIFGNVDDGGDVIHPGAFSKTIQERGRRVKVFYAHDWNKLIGPPPEVLTEDSKGLFARGRLTLDSFWGREVWALMKDGALTEGSIGYEAVKFDYDESGVRNLREVKLYEISPVPLGMNALTELRAVKGAQAMTDGDALASAVMKALNAARGAALEALGEAKTGRVLSAGNKEKVQNAIAALSAAMDALQELLAAAEPEKQLHSALMHEAARYQKILMQIGG